MRTHHPPLPTYFISHGGGPWPWMKADQGGAYDQLEAALKAMPGHMGSTPKAVLVISGHWEERKFTVMSSPQPPMIYDYSGFPAHTYRISYPAPGWPLMAERVRQLIEDAGFPALLDPQRGFDHGAFVPLSVIYPEADIPVLQLSLRQGYDPSDHIAMGLALQPLRSEGVLILASGLSYHNIREFGPRATLPSAAFDQWLQQTLVACTPEERIVRLVAWESAPGARQSHPQADHLLPLMVAVGAAGSDPGTCIYHQSDFFDGITVSSFMFGGVADSLPP